MEEEFAIEGGTQVEKRFLAQELLDFPLNGHEKFDEIWEKEGHRHSFHNQHHIEAVEKAFLTYFDRSTQDNDPLNIYNDLRKWNEEHGGEMGEIALDEFRKIVLWAIRYHDTGNIASILRVDEDGNLSFDYLKNEEGKVTYKA